MTSVAPRKARKGCACRLLTLRPSSKLPAYMAEVQLTLAQLICASRMQLKTAVEEMTANASTNQYSLRSRAVSTLVWISVYTTYIIYEKQCCYFLHVCTSFCKQLLQDRNQYYNNFTNLCEVSYCLQQIFFEALLYKEKGKSVIVMVKRYSLSYHSMGICSCMQYCYER